MLVCDAHPAERATTLIRLPSGKALTFCQHHTRQVIDQMVEAEQEFTIEDMN